MLFYQCFNNFVFVIIPARLLLSVELVTGIPLIFLSVIIFAPLERSSVDLTVIIGFFITSLTIIACPIAAKFVKMDSTYITFHLDLLSLGRKIKFQKILNLP